MFSAIWIRGARAFVALMIVGAVLGVAVILFYKPSRALFPQLYKDLLCHNDNVCVEALSQRDQADSLYQAGVGFVEQKFSALRPKPRAVFCVTQRCAQFFGIHKQAAINVAGVSIVVSPRGWQKHFIRHELIHSLQIQKLGLYRYFFKTPQWFVEGMAYADSEDPRILKEPWQGMRAKYKAWAASRQSADRWKATLAE